MLLGFMSQFQLQNSDGSEFGSVMLGIHFGSHSIKWALFTFNFISSDSDKHLGYLHIVCTWTSIIPPAAYLSVYLSIWTGLKDSTDSIIIAAQEQVLTQDP